MIGYYVRLSLTDIRRSLVVTLLFALTLGVGVAASSITYALIHFLSADPLPHKSAKIMRLQMNPFPALTSNSDTHMMPDWLTWQDSLRLTQQGLARFQAGSVMTWGMVTPVNEDAPFQSLVRATQPDFFAIFDIPFSYGSAWHAEQEGSGQPLVVLSSAMNQRLFGGENSVGRELQMLGGLFRVSGVLAPWSMKPRIYDMAYGAFEPVEDFFIPLSQKQHLGLPHGGYLECPEQLQSYTAYYVEECVNLAYWLELDSDQNADSLLARLNDYVQQQQDLGRFQQSDEVRLSTLMQWLEDKNVVTSDYRLMLILSGLFLLVCIINGGSLVHAGLAGKQRDIALRRALGACQSDILYQYAVMVALLIGMVMLVSLIISTAGLLALAAWYPHFAGLLKLDITVTLTNLGISIVSVIFASLFSLYRAACQPPAQMLRQGA